MPHTLPPHPVLKHYYEDESARRKKIDSLFDASASHYDWINGMMSFGSGRWYRRGALVRAGCTQGSKVLDVGAGTGVITKLAQDMAGGGGVAAALDPSRGMLDEAISLGVTHTIMGMGETLPFPDDYFDLLTMGYALRHVADLNVAFKEYLRVLKPGGKVLILEISKPASKISTALLKFYLKGCVPNAARIFRRSADAKLLMQYYWDTIEACVPPAAIVAALAAAGFEAPARHVIFGLFSEYTGTKKAT